MSEKDDAPNPILVAFGGYLEALRKDTGLSYDKLASGLGIGLQTLFRIDKGQAEARILTIYEYMTRVNGTFADLEYLAQLPEPTREAGEARAQLRIQRLRHLERAGQPLTSLLNRIAEAAADDPDLIPQLNGYLDGLSARRS